MPDPGKRTTLQDSEHRGGIASRLRAAWPLLALAGASFVAHMLVAGNYGYFRDELYYMADGRHLQAGYVDQPALTGWLAALLHVTAGDGLVAIHVIPALACALIIVITGLMARELGGGRKARLLAAVAALFAPVFMGTGSLFSMDVLDQLWWSLGSLALARLLNRDDARQWLLFGLAAALGFLTKLTILFFGVAVVLALLVTPQRRHLLTPWPWLAAGIAVLGLLPYLAWNALNGWPTWDFYHHYRGIGTNPLAFLANQLALMNPVSVPLAVAGLVFYFRRTGQRHRLLGWIFVFAFVILAALRVKPYLLAPAFPILFAAGAVALERIRLPGIRPAYVSLLALIGLLIAPLAMPILPPAIFARTYGAHSGSLKDATGQKQVGIFPQPLGDRFGWDSLTRTVESVYDALPPEERAQACVLTANYGEASALSLLAGPGRLPPVLSGHNNYSLWGPGRCTGQVLIVVGFSSKDVRTASAYYSQVTRAAVHRCEYCMPSENDLPVYVLSGPRRPDFKLATYWPLLKHYD